MIFNEVCETNSNTTFFEEVFEEESRNNENDIAVSIAALAVTAIALTGVAPIIDSRQNDNYEGWHETCESSAKGLGLKFTIMEAVFDQIKSIPA